MISTGTSYQSQTKGFGMKKKDEPAKGKKKMKAGKPSAPRPMLAGKDMLQDPFVGSIPGKGKMKKKKK